MRKNIHRAEKFWGDKGNLKAYFEENKNNINDLP